MDIYPREYMTAEESHYCGEPCFHVVQFYERERIMRKHRLSRYSRFRSC